MIFRFDLQVRDEIICAQGDGASVAFVWFCWLPQRCPCCFTKEQVTTQRLWSRALQFQMVKTFAVPSSMGAAWLCLGSTSIAADGGPPRDHLRPPKLCRFGTSSWPIAQLLSKWALNCSQRLPPRVGPVRCDSTQWTLKGGMTDKISMINAMG